MNNNLILQKDYSKYPIGYQLQIATETDILIQADDSVRLLNEVLEGINYKKLYATYSKEGRNPKTNPKTMFKVLVYAHMENINSSRKIEKSCKRDVNYMWLLNGEKAPNYQEICRFRSERLPEVMEDLFYQLVEGLELCGEIKYENLFIDGTKIEANANKYSFVWKKSTDRYESKLNEKINELKIDLKKSYDIFNESIDLYDIRKKLIQIKEKEKIEFVYGRGKKKTQIQRYMEQIEEYIQRHEKYTKYQETFAGRNSFSKTDTDATFMRMKEDHMRNAQLKPGYNVQLGVEAEYIVGVDISTERSDQLTLIPLLKKMKEETGKEHKSVIADAGYESEENYSYFEENTNTDCYIKPQNYDRSKKRKYKNNMNLRENMLYDIEKDEYICQNNKKLKVVSTRKRKSKSGYESEVTVYESENCEDCTYKDGCTKAKGNRKIYVSKKFIAQKEKSLKNITSEKGILLRMNRSIQVEGAFGVIKQDYGFRQFLLRGKKKVFTEMLLIAFAYNVNKLHNKIQDERLGKDLFLKNTS